MQNPAEPEPGSVFRSFSFSLSLKLFREHFVRFIPALKTPLRIPKVKFAPLCLLIFFVKLWVRGGGDFYFEVALSGAKKKST